MAVRRAEKVVLASRIPLEARENGEIEATTPASDNSMVNPETRWLTFLKFIL